MRRAHPGLTALALALALVGAACGDDEEQPAVSGDAESTDTTAADEGQATESGGEGAVGPTGPACDAFP